MIRIANSSHPSDINYDRDSQFMLDNRGAVNMEGHRGPSDAECHSVPIMYHLVLGKRLGMESLGRAISFTEKK